MFFLTDNACRHCKHFQAYSEAVNQRTQGAEIAAKMGAVGVIVRSLNLKLDDQPHTGL